MQTGEVRITVGKVGSGTVLGSDPTRLQDFLLQVSLVLMEVSSC